MDFIESFDPFSFFRQTREKETFSIKPRAKRHYSRRNPYNSPIHSSTSTVFKVALSSLKPSFQTKEGWTIVEVERGEDCLLHAFFQGLRRNTPEIAYTPQELRQIGIEWIREQIKTNGQYAAEVSKLLKRDWYEYNLLSLSGVERQLQYELNRIKKAFDRNNRGAEGYANQVQVTKEKYHQLKVHLAETVLIHSEEEFLQQLAKKGFFCSTLHLFALSAYFQVPVHVHIQAEENTACEIQVFNPTQSNCTPLHLYQTQHVHYQLLILPS